MLNSDIKYLNSELQTQNGSERNHFVFVAGTGLEPATFGL
jgi:hypothetical protein